MNIKFFNTKSTLIALSFLFLGGVLYLGSQYKEPKENVVATPNEPKQEVATSQQWPKTLDQRVVLVSSATGMTHYELQASDATSEVSQVIIPSVKKAIPELQRTFNLDLHKLSFPQNSNVLYFVEVLDFSDAPPGAVYALDITTHTFRKLAVSDYYGGFGSRVLSPDGKQVVTTFDPNDNGKTQKLFLLDLDADSSKTIVTLSGNETFNYCMNDCLGGNDGRITWVDDHTIEYTVFDASKSGLDVRSNVIGHPVVKKRLIHL